jgi:hypothetical protein
MSLSHVFRADKSNVGDWFCPPFRYFSFPGTHTADVLPLDTAPLQPHVLLGGGGLLAQTFHPHLQKLADLRPKLRSLVAWGVGESENIDRAGGFVLPFAGPPPDYLKAFDLVGVRDYGTPHRWVPCASCMHPDFLSPAPVTHPIALYEHKRIPIPIEGFPRLSNDGADLPRALNFLASAEVIITNSYHGAYWATLLGRRVIAIPNMSKMYRLKHLPVLCRVEHWKKAIDLTTTYPNALAECRNANLAFYAEVQALHASLGL